MEYIHGDAWEICHIRRKRNAKVDLIVVKLARHQTVIKNLTSDIKCFECNGQENADCARGENLSEVSCNGYSKTCVTGIDAIGLTHRGCEAFNDYTSRSLQFSGGFQRCYDNLCNNEIFPSNRTQCYRCDGENCDYVINSKRFLKPCYLLNDQCYAYKSSGISWTESGEFMLNIIDGNFHRGCMTDANPWRDLCKKYLNSCNVCFGSACNDNESNVTVSAGRSLRSYFSFIGISLLLIKSW